MLKTGDVGRDGIQISLHVCKETKTLLLMNLGNPQDILFSAVHISVDMVTVITYSSYLLLNGTILHPVRVKPGCTGNNCQKDLFLSVDNVYKMLNI